MEDETYDEMDVESVVIHGYDEDEDMDANDAAFLRGFLDIGAET